MLPSKGVKYEPFQNKTAGDKRHEEDGLDAFVSSFCVRVEYYRSVEFCLSLKGPMNTRRSSKSQKATKKNSQRSPSPDEDLIQRRSGRKRRGAGPTRTGGEGSAAGPGQGSARDLVDLINSKDGAEQEASGGPGRPVEIRDGGLDASDEDGCMDCSFVSGPSLLLCDTTPKKMRPARAMCSSCLKLHRRAKRMKAPIKDKLLDNNPSSLTCDQWVLLKKWRLRRLPDAAGTLLMHVQRLKSGLGVTDGSEQNGQRSGDKGSSGCSRPHTFLQRNLRGRAGAPVKKARKRNARKRARDDSLGSRAAKQKRPRGNNLDRHVSMMAPDDSLNPASGPSTQPGGEDCGDREDANVTGELIPAAVASETTEPTDIPAEKKAAKKGSAFRDLLAQLRGNSSMIVREAPC